MGVALVLASVVAGAVALVYLVRLVVLIIFGPGAQRRRRARNDAVLFADCTRPSLFKAIPSSPRCQLCRAPFGGLGPILLIRPSRKNPRFCQACLERAPVGGYEMDIGVLFADVRGFTASSEKQTPAATAALLNRFYRVAYDVLVDHDAIIDKLVGDEVMALFLPPVPTLGERTSEVMVDAAESLLRGVGFGEGMDPWLALGIGAHFGPAYVGNVGAGEVKDFTAIGDVVNTAARLQATAQAGEIVVSECVYEHVADRYPSTPPLQLQVKGKEVPVAARRLKTVR